MITITIDTSVFIELILGQEKAEQSEVFLASIAKGELTAHVSHYAVHAVQASFHSPNDVREFLKDIKASKGLHVYDSTLDEESAIAALALEVGLDFDDAVQYYVAKETNSSAIVSFDRHFDRLKDIKRKDPASVLKEMLGKEASARN